MLKSTNISNHGYTSTSPFRRSENEVVDAQGNILATYTKDGSNEIKLGEYNLYGSSRLGTASYNTTMSNLSLQNSGIYNRTLGLKRYEISNHLGNVLTVFSDKKHTLTNNHTTPYILSTTDYDPFGMIMNGRDWNPDRYRFGFNGMENDEEVRGNRSSYTTEFRIFDAQICRWLSVDPKAIKFTGISPYHFGYNSPLIVIDPNGDENVVTVGNQGSNIDKPISDKKGDGSYMYGNNTRHFLERGLKEAIKLKAKDGNEKTSMIVYNTGQYTENEINAYKQRAIDAKIDFYEVKSADEMISYINDQSTQFHNNVEPGGRGGDPITDFTYVGHGSPRGFLVGYNDSDDEQFDVSSFKKKSFTDNANFTLLGCAQGLSSNDMKKHYPNSSETLFDQLLKFTNGKIEAYTVTVTWGGALGNFVPHHEGYLYPSDRNNGTFSRDFVPPSKRKVIMKGNLK